MLNTTSINNLQSQETVARLQYFKDGSIKIVRTCGLEALSMTTLRHIKAGLGMNKQEFLAIS